MHLLEGKSIGLVDVDETGPLQRAGMCLLEDEVRMLRDVHKRRGIPADQCSHLPVLLDAQCPHWKVI